MKIVLFLGAGFSARFGQPVMNDFMGFADSCKRLTEEDRKFLGELILESRRANSFLESSPTNLEDILSFSVMGERLNLVENRSQTIQDMLRKVYTDVRDSERYWGKYSGALNKLLGHKIEDLRSSLSFVTTNYDLNVESACFSYPVQITPGFHISRVKSEANPWVEGHLYSEVGIPIYKLHGSVNWYRDDANESGILVEDKIVRLEGFREEKRLSLPWPCTSDYQPPDFPLIIPPSFLKPDLSAGLKTIWKAAAKALSEASIIVFVGYSFPPSDTEMMYFLGRSLMDNHHLRHIYIVDPKVNHIVRRMEEANSKIGSHFKSLIRPIEAEWQHATLNPPIPKL